MPMVSKSKCPVNVNSYYNYYCLLMGYINGDKLGRMCVREKAERFPRNLVFLPRKRRCGSPRSRRFRHSGVYWIAYSSIYWGWVRRQSPFSLLVYPLAHWEESSFLIILEEQNASYTPSNNSPDKPAALPLRVGLARQDVLLQQSSSIPLSSHPAACFSWFK